MNFIGIIPARYASTRFPGKPLALIDGRPMVVHVAERAARVLSHVVVATDDPRILDAVTAHGHNAVLTRADHRSGTDRCAEACLNVRGAFSPDDVVINIQGDEPFVHPEQISLLADCFADNPATEIATLVRPVPAGTSWYELANPNRVKAVVSPSGQALWFSRMPIPFLRGVDNRDQWTSAHTFFTHVGMYAYRADILQRLTRLEPSPLEQAESLEQLRWLENGYAIAARITHQPTIGIDTPDDLQRAISLLNP